MCKRSRDEVFESLRLRHIKAWTPGYGGYAARAEDAVVLMRRDVQEKFFYWRMKWYDELVRAFPEKFTPEGLPKTAWLA